MKVSEIQQALRDERLDGWLFFDHHRRDPLAYRVLDLTLPREPTRRWYYFIPAQGEPRGLVHRIEASMLDGLPGGKSTYASWSQLVEGLKSLLAGCQAVAMQYSPNCAVPYVSLADAGTVDLVRGLGVEVRSSADLIQYFEARWDQHRLDTHLEAGRRMDQIRREAFAWISESLNGGRRPDEWTVKQFILECIAEGGMVRDHGPIVAVNAHAGDPHYEPSEGSSLEIRRGDVVLIDMWAKLAEAASVYYDITWTGYCGPRPPDAVENVFQIVRGARDKAVECVQRAVTEKKPLRGYEVDDAARGYIERHGFGQQFFHRTGHSIGEEVHGAGANMDNLETHDERRIIPWTCFSIEPGVYLPEFGIRSEVNVFVEEGGARVTGEIQQAMVLI